MCYVPVPKNMRLLLQDPDRVLTVLFYKQDAV